MSVLNVDEALATHFAKAPENVSDGFMAADIKTKTLLRYSWSV